MKKAVAYLIPFMEKERNMPNSATTTTEKHVDRNVGTITLI